MKKTVKRIVLLVIVICLFVSVIPLSVSASSASVSAGTYNVGDTVKVSIRYTADNNIASVEGTLSYNSSVLQYAGISGVPADDAVVSGGSVHFLDTAFSGNTKTGSYTVTFKAIAVGTSSMGLNIEGGDSSQAYPAKANSVVTVKTPEPSSNANLSSITVTNATLSPGFSSNTTNYVAIAKYSVDKVTIKATAVHNKANIVGAGTFDIKVGDNNHTITVTAENGTKKSYEVNVKRLTQEETAILEEQERASDPSLVIVDGVDYHIATDISDKGPYEGFALSSAEYKVGQVPVLSDENGKYSLYYLIADDQSVSDWFYKSKDDELKRLNYILIGNRLYIIEKCESDFKAPDGYYSTSYELTTGKVKAFKSDNKSLNDFYVLYCYLNGENGFYIFDSKENTMQRAPAFGSDVLPVDSSSKKGNLLEIFNSISVVGKIIIVCLFAIVVLVIVLIVFIILKIKSNREDMPLPLFTEESQREFDQITDLNDYVGNDGNQDNDEIF